MSLLKAWRSVVSVNGPPDTPKKSRFSLLTRPSARSHGPALDIELPDSGGAFWTTPSSDHLGVTGEDVQSERDGERDGEVTLERSFTLSILEGRKHAVVVNSSTPRGSTGTSNTYVSARELAFTPTPSLKTSPPKAPPVPPKSRARSASTSSGRSASAEGRHRKPSLRPQALGLPELEEARLEEPQYGREHDQDSRGLPPTYSSSSYPTHEVTYRFAQAGPFAMSLEAEGKQAESMGIWRYHIGVGMNVWTLKSWVTTVRRGGKEGLVVAEIDSKMYFIGDGTAIRWNLGDARWEAYFDSVELATLELKPSRRLVMQPLAHRFFDHLVVSALLLMREKENSACSAGTVPPSPLG
ncbi:hypothetical protein BC628DRAFT_1417381 [Trametes gibbosa]|nr:hypothetical protein BC628DRAFT_1417381 [Trametes gibbosa]